MSHQQSLSNSPESIRIHPSYNSPDAGVDIVCNSGQGLHFHVHSGILSLASEIFKEKILEARESGTGLGDGVENADMITFPLDEDDTVMKNLLDAIHPNVDIAFPSDLAFTALVPVAEAAKRYNVTGVLYTIRRTAFNVRLSDFHPLERYKLACRLEWKKEALLSAKLSLKTDLMTNESIAYLQGLSHDSILALIWFHGSRRVLREPGHDYRNTGLELPGPSVTSKMLNALMRAGSRFLRSSPATTTTAPFYHPSYNSEDADLVLVADWGHGSCFRLHSTVLKAASEFFSNMLLIQRVKTEDKESPIPIAEKDDVLKNIFDSIYPNVNTDFPQGLPFALLFDIAIAADKYHFPRILTTVRRYVINVNYSVYTPLKLYKLACRFEWMEEANALSSSTLMTDLMSDKYMRVLHTIETCHVLKLFRLHRCRQDIALKYFDLPIVGPVEDRHGYKSLLTWDPVRKKMAADRFRLAIKRNSVAFILKDEFWTNVTADGLDGTYKRSQGLIPFIIQKLPKTVEESERIWELDPRLSGYAPRRGFA